MSIGKKTGKLYYSEDELQKALGNNDPLQYAMSRGYDLKREGSYYHWREHDSMVFSPKGYFSWNSQGISKGNALDFITKVEGRSYIEAVLTLAGTLDRLPPVGKIKQQYIPQEYKPKPFVLPERAANNDIVFNYLFKERGIDRGLIDQLLYQGKIYQAKAYNTLVMVGFDGKGVPRYASRRSTSGEKFGKDVSGSQKKYPFVVDTASEPNKANTVCTFESPIEVMSYWTLCKELGSERIQCPMIAQGGANSLLALEQYLSEHPHISHIVCGLNNDSDTLRNRENGANTGQIWTDKIREKFGEKYTVESHTPHLNDWNDVLKNYRQIQPQQGREKPIPHKTTPQHKNPER